MKTQACLAFTALAIALTGAPATAATFSYDVTDVTVKDHQDNAGTFKAISSTFNDVTQQFTWSSTFGYNAEEDTLAESAWLVVNDGPNPRKDVNEHVIFYLDGLNEKVTAYNYNGEKGARSWQTSELLGTKDLDVTTTDTESNFSFSWNMADINGMTDKFGDNWTGAAFDEEIGLWFHGLDAAEISYAADGRLTEFTSSISQRSAYDPGNKPTAILNDETKDIPEPGMVMALGMTAAAAAFTKRRKAFA